MDLKVSIEEIKTTLEDIKNSNIGNQSKQIAVIGLVELITASIERNEIGNDEAKPLAKEIMNFLIGNMCEAILEELK